MGGDSIERRRRELESTKKGTTEPYASIPASQLACGIVRRLSGTAVRVLLFAHAAWTPKSSAPLPTHTIASTLAIDKRDVGKALAELQPALLTIKTPAVRPGAMGSVRGSAAVFAVAGRVAGTAQRVFEAGDRRLAGAFRIRCTDLRHLATILNANEARIMVCVILACDRDRHGAPVRLEPIPLSGRPIAAALQGMSPRAADMAITGLATKGLIRLISPAAGRRPAFYVADGLAASTIRRGRRGNTSAPLHVHGTLQGGRKSAHKPPLPNMKMADSRREDSAPPDVVRRFPAVDGGLCADFPPSNKHWTRNKPEAA